MDAAEKIRLLVCGDSGVGKKRLIEAFTTVGERKTSTLSTIGVDVQCKTVCVGGKTVKLQIWTTAGLENFQAVPANYYRRADGVILVYDVTRTDTFDSVRKWLANISENTTSRDVKIALVGNKIDLASSTNSSRGKTLASTNGILYFETSAATGENVEQLFLTLASEVLKIGAPCTREEFSVETEPSSEKIQPRRCCC